MTFRTITFLLLAEYSLAIQDFTTFLLTYPQDASAYYNRGLAYKHSRDIQKAQKDYTQAITLEPAFKSQKSYLP
ncbi:tetratricopeptide repeat protein [Dictyobacter vulcani]|uniref:tetratricopeptide repeat protein n=1 Tax=Dictyobacter vulcani TaxID=2607529 RepID=UPI0018E9F399